MEIERTGILTSISTTKRGTFISFICGAIKRNSYLIKVDDSLMNEIHAHALVGDHVRIKYKEDNDHKKTISEIERLR